MAKIILLASPKGGGGRSATARAILVASARSGMSVIGLDTDVQQTFKKWAQKRDRAMEAMPGAFSPVTVHAVRLASLGAEIKRYENADLIVCDTAPTVEESIEQVVAFASRADLVLVPTSSSADDLDSVLPWYRQLKARGATVEIVLNKVNRSSKSFIAARNRLVSSVELVPVEIPLYEDIANMLGKGLTVLDLGKLRGADDLTGLWGHVKRRLAL